MSDSYPRLQNETYASPIPRSVLHSLPAQAFAMAFGTGETGWTGVAPYPALRPLAVLSASLSIISNVSVFVNLAWRR